MNVDVPQPAVLRRRPGAAVPRLARGFPDAVEWEEIEDTDPPGWGAVVEDLLRRSSRHAHAAAVADLLPC